MLVKVATLACPVQTEKGAVQAGLVRFKLRLIHDKLRLVAGPALERGMFAVERQSGQHMVEFVLPTLPVDQCDLAPLVLDMTLFAVVVALKTVQAGSGVKPGSHGGVAGQTFVMGNLALGAVALFTVLYAIQKGV